MKNIIFDLRPAECGLNVKPVFNRKMATGEDYCDGLGVCSMDARNQSADILLEYFLFWLPLSPWAIILMEQPSSKNHAQSLPLQGRSMTLPSSLTTVPNFIGQHFCDDIPNNRF